MYVIATAGHVDHGKSTLVRALTGMEPDRWAEERRRGMTIDLGFAWTRLPSGAEIAFVDVPGHEKFATNMLAGVGPVPAVLLVIAADEGWAAQTEEHVRALDALQVRQGLVAVTRSDLADPAAAVAEASTRLAVTTLCGSPVVTVSGRTGNGLEELRGALDALTGRLPAPSSDTRVRLWVDRCFTIRGSGTVVTGTLTAGTVHTGDELELGDRSVTVRALQCLGKPVDEASGVARVALNLRSVAVDEVRRGDPLLSRAAWCRTEVVDVRSSAGNLPRDLVVHIGSAAVSSTVQKLSGGNGGEELVRLRLSTALPLQVGDRLLLRDPGRHEVLGGAIVLDPAPPPIARRGAARARAQDLAIESGVADLACELSRRGVAAVIFLRAIGVPIPDPLPRSAVAAGEWLVDRRLWANWRRQLHAAVHNRSPTMLLDTGVALKELVQILHLPDGRIVGELLHECPNLEEVHGRVRQRGAGTALHPDVAIAVGRLRQLLKEQPFVAPEKPTLVAFGLGTRELGAAAAAGTILRLPGDICLLPDAPQLALPRLREVPQPFSVSTARQALGTSRRVAVPLLEYMDSLRLTQRVEGGLRCIRGVREK